ncbi:MAG: transcription antitermination protein NusB [Bacteroides sp.]|nr:transcription antitermination protein NusB [Bacteroides sp.]
MVNRVLIRLKVVQMLYSYMLTRSEFKIEMPAETSSPDRRYSFKAYAELLLLILELSGRRVVNEGIVPASVTGAVRGAKFEDTRMSVALMANEEVRDLINKYGIRMRSFDAAVPEAVARLKGSTAYRVFSKVKGATVADEITFWTTAIRSTLIKTDAVIAALRTDPDFTVRGMEMGAKMLIETLQGFSDTRSVLSSCKNDLMRSLQSAYALYKSLVWLPVDITRAQAERLEANAAKYLPTDEDLNPDRRFVDAAFIRAIEENPAFEEWDREHPYAFANDHVLIENLLNQILSSTYYQEFMSAPGHKSREDEAELWRQLIRHVILPSDDLAESLENRSIFWNDDLEVMSSFALKTLRQIGREGAEVALLPEFKDEEDAEFGFKLFDAVVNHMDEYRELIDSFVNTSKWDTERLALMDIVILRTALAEVLEFPKIPLQVTANEYVEIANCYSTARSGAFINGMLAAITEKLRAEGRIQKSFSNTKK